MDQFTHAERATDWRGNNNIAESIFAQLRMEPHPVPEWIVVGAGTGGTSATIGRYVRYRGHATRLCVPDPEGSAFFEAWCDDDPDGTGARVTHRGHRPATGRAVVRRTRSSTGWSGCRTRRRSATMREVEAVLGRRVGPSTGTNLWAAFGLIAEMRATRHPPARSSPCCATPATGTHGPTTTTTGWPRRAGTCAPGRAVVREFLRVPATWPADEPIAAS